MQQSLRGVTPPDWIQALAIATCEEVLAEMGADVMETVHSTIALGIEDRGAPLTRSAG